MRLREETEYRPKPLVTIGGMPLLWHIMKTYSHFGITEFVLALGYRGEMIRDYFLNFEEMKNDFTLDLRNRSARVIHHNAALEDWKITFVDTGQSAQTGARIAQLEPYVKDETFFLTYGDGVANIDLAATLALHRRTRKMVTLTAVHPESVFGIVEHEDGHVKSFKEKPRGDTTINGGFFVCEPELFRYLSTNDDCIFEQEPLRALAEEGKLGAYDHAGFWYCVDTYKHYEDLNKRWAAGDRPWAVWEQGPATPIQTVAPTPVAPMPQASAPHAPKTILVTGGTGLVGGHVVEAALTKYPGAHVVVLVQSIQPQSYFAERGLEKRVTCVYGDVRDARTVRDAVLNFQCDTILHLAAQPIVNVALANPHETWETNLMGTVNVLEAARTSPWVKAIVVASSDKAYGDAKFQPYTEEHPLEGLHPYDASKSATDLIARSYARCYGMPVVVSRFGNIFGPGDLNWNRLVPGIMRARATGETFMIRSNGLLTRDFVYVKDVADVYLLLAEHAPQYKGEAFNCTSGVHGSVLDMVERIGRVTGMPVPHKVLNEAQYEIPAQSLSDRKLRETFGWAPAQPFDTALHETWEWYRTLLERHRPV